MLRSEVTTLINSRTALQTDIARLRDSRDDDSNKYIAIESDYKQRLESLERQLLDGDSKIKQQKEMASALQNQGTLLRCEVEDLSRQQTELHKTQISRQSSMQDEISHARMQVQSSLQTLRQLQSQVDRRRFDLDSLNSECGTMERKIEDARRRLRDEDSAVTLAVDRNNDLKLAHEKLLEDLEIVKKSENQKLIQMNDMKAALETTACNLEETKRKVNLLHEEEASLIESCSRLKASSTESKKVLIETQHEIDKIYSSLVRERTSVSDLRAIKATLEADVCRWEVELRSAKERCLGERQRCAEADSALVKVRDEINELQRKFGVISKQVEESTSRLEDQRQIEMRGQIQFEKSAHDLLLLRANVDSEQRLFDALKLEHRSVLADVQQMREAALVAKADKQSLSIILETIRGQLALAEKEKFVLESDIGKLRELVRSEQARLESTENCFMDSSERLKQLRHDIQSSELQYQRSVSMTTEQDNRLADLRVILKTTSEELSSLQSSIDSAHAVFHAERSRAIEEIASLDQTKHHLHSQLFLASEAKKRSASPAAVAKRPGPQSLPLPTGSPVSVAAHHTPPSSANSLSGTLDIKFDAELIRSGADCIRERSSNPHQNTTSLKSTKDSDHDFRSLEKEVEKLRVQSLSVLRKRED